MPETCTIDGFGPLRMSRPASVAELGELVRQAAADNRALYPVGGQTMLDLGNAPTKPGMAVDLRGLDQIIDFPARDMTVTVQAGITIERLQATLAKENLRLPIDVPQAERATLGGILATNTSGPRRYGYGTLRDYVIGISAVNDEGKEFKAGGRVVKNVAGYDICKLLIGSLGTLGIITQATLKLRPLAEEQALVTLGCDDGRLPELLDQLHGSRTRPVVIDLLNQSATARVFVQAQLPAPRTPWVVVVGYEANAAAVHWQVEELIKEVGQANQLDAYVGFPASPLWRTLVEWGAWPGSTMTLKLTLLPSHVAKVAPFLGKCDDAHVRAHAGNGVVQVDANWSDARNLSGGLAPMDVAREWLQGFQSSGRAYVVRCPAAWKKHLQVWGPPRTDAWLMREVKAKFDPRGLFNPGRFVDGI